MCSALILAFNSCTFGSLLITSQIRQYSYSYVTLVWNFSPVLLQTALGTAVFSSRGCSHTKHQFEGRRTRNVTKPVNQMFSSFISDAKTRYFIRLIPDLVSHYGEVIHSQFTGIYPDFPQSLSSISVEQDPEPLTLLVERFYPLTDLLNWLTRGKHIRLYCTQSHRQS